VTTISVNDDPFLTRTEAAALMRLNPRTLDNLAAMKKGPPYMRTAMLCGRVLYRRSAVIAYLEACGRQTDPPCVNKRPQAKRKTRQRDQYASGLAGAVEGTHKADDQAVSTQRANPTTSTTRRRSKATAGK
jgi:hypothetical protein